MNVRIGNTSLDLFFKQIDYLIILSIFLLIPIDLLNGFFINNGLHFKFSVAQLYKFYLLIVIFIALFQNSKYIEYLGIIFVLLFISSVLSAFQLNSVSFFSFDIIKIVRYLTVVVTFFYFKNFFQQRGYYALKYVKKILLVSYILIATSILLKYLGFGYPMYAYGNLGSKGMFSAGNEVSVLTITISSLIGLFIWKKKKIMLYIIFFIFNLIVGLAIGSKTASVGSIIMLSLIPLRPPSLRINFKRFFIISGTILTLIPTILYFSWKYISSSSIYIRIYYFYDKFDIYTFLLSSRNVFLEESFTVYKESYNLLEKIFGVGESRYLKLNLDKAVESDFFDIFFAYGVVGALLFVFFIGFLLVQFRLFSKAKFTSYPFANFGILILIFLVIVSTLAGHTFSSGMAAPFIGLALALPYFKKENDANSIS